LSSSEYDVTRCCENNPFWYAAEFVSAGLPVVDTNNWAEAAYVGVVSREKPSEASVASSVETMINLQRVRNARK